MTAIRASRDRQRGNSMVLALIVLSALGTLGSLTVISVQSSLKASTNDRAQKLALYAAESGGAVAIEYLRNHYSGVNGWSAYVRQNNAPAYAFTTAQIASTGAAPGAAANPLSADQAAWYELVVLNNLDDPGFAAATDFDTDGRITIRSTGHGPLGAIAIVEWDVQRARSPAGGPPLTLPPAPASTTTPVVILGWRIALL